LTNQIIVIGDVDTSKVGTYPITYEVSDSDGNTSSKTIEITVTSNDKPVINGAEDESIEIGTSFDAKKDVTASDTEDGDLTNQIIVIGDVDTSKVGTYPITYEVSDSDGNTSSKTIEITVTSNDKPVINGAEDESIDIGTSFDAKKDVTASDTEDGDLTSQIEVDGIVDTNRAGTYELTYTVTDSDSNLTTLVRAITVYDNTIFRFNQAPDDLMFQTTEISSNEIEILRQNPDWNLQVQDTRNNGEKWQVTGTVNGPFVDVDNPNAKQLHDALTYTKDGIETRIMDNQVFVMGEGTSNPTEVTTIQYTPEEGLHMKINPTGVKAGSQYQTSITWTLNDTP
ncbi:DUF5011 domain-containing protein, partial [Listeria sp. FSL L7-1582]|uniref:DUF5011 domain-containing protein n=1 Tax=Listeria portnoyi TaxID=2713504 RepID=UPI00164ED520